jgi:hypothetical protein
MKWLSAGLIFVNLSTVCGLLLGIAGSGLNASSALLALICGAAFALAAWLRTFDPDKSNWRTRGLAAPKPGEGGSPASRASASEALPVQHADLQIRGSEQVECRLEKNAPKSTPASWSYGKIWLWLLGLCFLMFAVRSFCWLIYIDGTELRIQSPNNLGDLSLHITLIRNFANGVALWPDNPIYVFSKLRYPAGMDLFNALLCLIHVDLTRGLVWTGLLASLATFYAFFRWAGAFGVAGFLFNGGIAGFQFFDTHKFLDYQGDKAIAWKSIALSMFVTQRGLLYAIPAGVVLLWHWRETYFRRSAVAWRDVSAVGSANEHEPGRSTPVNARRSGPLPFWVELSLYASMPLFHVHTFLALSIILFFLFIFECLQPLKFIVDLLRTEGIGGIRRLISDPAGRDKLVGPTRMHALRVVASALLPAFVFGWLITDHFHAGSMVKPHLGWVMADSALGRASALQFWSDNFGIFIPLALFLIAICGWRAWKNGINWNQESSEAMAFLLPALTIFVSGLLFQFAPWEWDNLKIMTWGYFLVLPFLWRDLIAHWNLVARVIVCISLFGSGFISLLGGLSVGRPGFGIANRMELAGVGDAVKPLPAEARFAAYPTFNHPLLLQGRKVVLGYPGHLWSQGFADYPRINSSLNQLMQGAENWRDIARTLHVRYIFWGREETAHYAGSKRPWEGTAPVVASGPWGAIYDLDPTANQG